MSLLTNSTRRVRLIISIALVFFIQLVESPTLWAQASEENAIKELLTLTWPKAIVNRDSTLLSQILGDEYEKVDSFGNWFNKSGEIERTSALDFAPDSVFVEVTRTHFMGIKNALAVSRSVELSNNEEGKYSTSYWSSHLLERRGSNWKVISSHVSGRKISMPGKRVDKF